MLRLITIGILLLFSPINIISALDNLSISGSLQESESKTPVELASVVLYSLPDTVMVAGTISKDDGSFMFKNLKPGAYLLKCTALGYRDKICNITLQNKSFSFPAPLLLQPSAYAINEVTVSATPSEKHFTIEKTRINATGTLGASTGSVLEILRSASSITIDNNDRVSIRGNDNILILLDGMPTTVDNLNHIASDNIQTIEIITSPDVTHDSEGTGGIVNIISKRNAMTGLNGMVTATYGFMNKFNGSAALNYNINKYTLRLNYSTKYEREIIDSDLFRYFYSTKNSISQDIHANKRTTNNIVGINVSYRPNIRDKYSLGLKLLLPRMNNFQNFNNRYINETDESTLFRQNDINFNREVFEGSFIYNRTIEPRKRELSFAAAISAIRGHRPSFYYENHELCQKSISGGHPLLSNIQADYKTNIWHGKLEVGLKMTYRQNNISHSFYEYDDETSEWLQSSFYSNDLQHREYIPALYGMFTKKYNEHFLLKVGLRAEHSVVTLHSNHEVLDTKSQNLFISPQLTATYTFSRQHSLAGGFTRRITRPTYPQLNPYTNVIDNTTFETGNIHLAPETINKVDLGYSFNGDLLTLNANCYLNFSNKFITQVATVQKQSLILTYINGNWDKKAGLDLSLILKPLRTINISLNSNTFHSSTSAAVEGIRMHNKGWCGNNNVLLNYKLLKDTEVSAQYFFTTPQYFPQFTVKKIHYLNVGVKQILVKGKLTAHATLTDVFNTRRWNVTSDNPIYRLVNNSRTNTRMCWIGVTYNFNSYKQDNAKKVANDEENNLIRLGQ